ALASVAFEICLALFAEGLDPLVRVVGHEDTPDRLAFECQSDVDGAAVAERGRELGVTDRDTRALAELRRVIDRRGVACGGVGVEAVDESELFGLRRLHRRGIGDEVDGAREADAPRQPLRAARPREQSKVHLWKSDLI